MLGTENRTVQILVRPRSILVQRFYYRDPDYRSYGVDGNWVELDTAIALESAQSVIALLSEQLITAGFESEVAVMTPIDV